jgi:antitoxin component of MazEF toxin-antitoxin module
MITTIKRVGNSAGVIIPSALLKQMGLRVGTEIDLTVEGDTLKVKPVEPRRARSELTLEWLLADFSPEGA